MYGITNDYFDSFTAIFGPKECLLNGKRYPLGHFAMEALEMDRRLLQDLEKAVADFKPELEVFLAARTASSAAVAQQKLDAVWAVLAQLPGAARPPSYGDEGWRRGIWFCSIHCVFADFLGVKNSWCRLTVPAFCGGLRVASRGRSFPDVPILRLAAGSAVTAAPTCSKNEVGA